MIKVDEDPVRKAARSAMANLLDPLYDDENEAGREYIDTLREALARPAPPSLTEDERKALLKGRDALLPSEYRTWESAREKLS